MFDWIGNRLQAMKLKYWAHSCSQSSDKAEKILSRKICMTSFLCRSNRPKGSLKKLLSEISQNSQLNMWQNLFFDKVKFYSSAASFKARLEKVFSCEFWKFVRTTFFAEHHHTTASDYSSIIPPTPSPTQPPPHPRLKITLPWWGGFPPRSFYPSAPMRRAQLSITVKVVRPTDLLKYVRYWFITD